MDFGSLQLTSYVAGTALGLTSALSPPGNQERSQDPPASAHPLRVAMLASAPNHHTTRWIRALRKAGLDVHLVTDEQGNELAVGDAPVQRVQLEGGRHLFRDARRWRTAIAAVQPDVIYMQWLRAKPSLMLALRDGPALVTTVMGSDVRQHQDMAESWLKRRMRRHLLARAHCSTAASAFLVDIVRGYIPTRPESVHRLPFGVDSEKFSPSPRGQGGAEHEPVCIGHFKGDLTTYGRLTLLEALAPLARDGLRFELHLVGLRGTDGGGVTAFLENNPELAQRVVDFGLLEVDAMPERYQNIDLYALPSRFESFGVAAAEALACGVPVIASDLPGVQDLVRHQREGLLVPEGDVDALREALQSLTQDHSLREAMGARGRQHIQDNFSWQDSVRTLVELLNSAR
jgi:glycosyltransferase involved in cell wall biosynthesis